MQKLIKIDNYNYTTAKANDLLKEGWKVIQMCPIAEPVATCGGYHEIKSNYGALLLLEKEEEKLKKEEN